MKTITTASGLSEQTAQVATENAAPAKKTTTSKKTAATKKRTSGKKAQKRAKPAPKAKKAAGAAREGSKTAKVLDLLKRPKGTSLAELMKATDWQPHSVRGFISGTVGKKLGLTVISEKAENGDRTYKIAR